MAANSENQINLKTLQRVDSNIIDIIDNTSQVAIYKYERKLEEWEGTDVEGTLFLYRRSVSPFHGFIIINRQNTTNFVESITSDMQFQLQEPYLLYKNTSGDIIGCWFYEHKDLKRISKKIQTIVLKQDSSAPRRQRCASESETHPPKEEGQDIIALLSQAHDKYMKNISSQTKEPKNNNRDAKECLQKSVPAFDATSQEVSPRRRFMSTGSFDSQRIASFSTPIKNANSGASAAISKRLLPLFSHTEESADKHYSEVLNAHPFAQCRKSLFNSRESPGPDESADKDAHFTSMKEALKAHVQDNPRLVLQIHEAYISSLRSLLTKT